MIYVSSYNIVSSLGNTVEENIEKIELNETGISLCKNKELSPVDVYVSQINMNTIHTFFNNSENENTFTDFEKLALYSIQAALEKSKIDASSEDTIFIISSTKGNIDLLKKEVE